MSSAAVPAVCPQLSPTETHFEGKPRHLPALSCHDRNPPRTGSYRSTPGGTPAPVCTQDTEDASPMQRERPGQGHRSCLAEEQSSARGDNAANKERRVRMRPRNAPHTLRVPGCGAPYGVTPPATQRGLNGVGDRKRESPTGWALPREKEERAMLPMDYPRSSSAAAFFSAMRPKHTVVATGIPLAG